MGWATAWPEICKMDDNFEYTLISITLSPNYNDHDLDFLKDENIFFSMD